MSSANPPPSLVNTHTEDGVCTITMCNPAARNSLSEAMIGALQDALNAVREDADARVVVIAAEGPAFCAGHDLKEIRANPDRAYSTRLFDACAQLMMSIVNLPKPVIARVHATATAAGCQLVASCDLAIASENARFATPGVNIGLFCSTPMVALSRNVGNKHAMEMLLTGDMIGAQDAMRMGLVNKVVSDGELDASVADLSARIAAKSAHTLKVGKEAFYKQAEMPLAEAYAYTSQVMVENLLSDDAVEGICAFVEKRAPKWTNS